MVRTLIPRPAPCGRRLNRSHRTKRVFAIGRPNGTKDTIDKVLDAHSDELAKRDPGVYVSILEEVTRGLPRNPSGISKVGHLLSSALHDFCNTGKGRLATMNTFSDIVKVPVKCSDAASALQHHTDYHNLRKISAEYIDISTTMKRWLGRCGVDVGDNKTN